MTSPVPRVIRPQYSAPSVRADLCHLRDLRRYDRDRSGQIDLSEFKKARGDPCCHSFAYVNPCRLSLRKSLYKALADLDREFLKEDIHALFNTVYGSPAVHSVP